MNNYLLFDIFIFHKVNKLYVILNRTGPHINAWRLIIPVALHEEAQRFGPIQNFLLQVAFLNSPSFDHVNDKRPHIRGPRTLTVPHSFLFLTLKLSYLNALSTSQRIIYNLLSNDFLSYWNMR